MRFADIGQQLRAYRLESGLRAEEIAARLGVSRAALYRYEKGEVIKLDTIRRLAELLKIPPPSLLGIGVEYFARPLALQERLRQGEEAAEQVLQVGGALCFQVSTDDHDAVLSEALLEAAEGTPGPDRLQHRATAEQLVTLLLARRRLYAQRRPAIIAMLGEGSLRRLLATGLAPDIAVSERLRARLRAAAVAEAENIAELMASEPMGLQLGLLAGADPACTFIVLRGRDKAQVCVGPFPADAPPAGAVGVGTVTAADEAVSIHQRVAENAWRDAVKGAAAAQRVRDIIRESALVTA